MIGEGARSDPLFRKSAEPEMTTKAVLNYRTPKVAAIQSADPNILLTVCPTRSDAKKMDFTGNTPNS